MASILAGLTPYALPVITAADVRRLIAALPHTEERETWGHPTFRVRDKMFAAMATDGSSMSVKARPEEQRVLVGSDPEIFSVPAYVGRHGWVGIDLARVDPEELRELITEAWRRTAPKRLVRAFDASESQAGAVAPGAS
jgi:hypothetical protein